MRCDTATTVFKGACITYLPNNKNNNKQQPELIGHVGYNMRCDTATTVFKGACTAYLHDNGNKNRNSRNNNTNDKTK
jgi:hypothetical protein